MSQVMSNHQIVHNLYIIHMKFTCITCTSNASLTIYKDTCQTVTVYNRHKHHVMKHKPTLNAISTGQIIMLC